MLAVVPGITQVPEQVPELTDQFGVSGGLVDPAGELQIAIVVSAKRLRRIRPWERALHEFDAGIPVVRIADVPAGSVATYEDVARTFRKRLPEDLSVLIDLEGAWVAAFDLDSSVPNLLIFGADGALLAQHSGMYKRPLFEALAADLSRLRVAP